MSVRSLRVRLIIAAALSLTLVLVAAGAALAALFEQQFQDRVSKELANHMRQLVAALDIADDGSLSVPGELADPRFSQPLGGLYWKVISSTGSSLTSRSLWDTDIAALPQGVASEAGKDRLLAGRMLDGTELLVLVRRITAARLSSDIAIDLEVAIEQREIAEPISTFIRQLTLSLALLAAFLVAAVWVQVGIGLRPLAALQQRLSEIRAGRASGFAGNYPDEITPLVSELNQLIEAQRFSLERARARAGDLAHGLKTPLAILTSVSRDLTRAGRKEAATEIEHQTEAMRVHVERELVRARLAAGRSRASCLLQPEFQHLITIMTRLPRGADIDWQIACPESLELTMDAVDFAELFGNILDNARKWARTRVRVEAKLVAGRLAMAVSDDGPGVAEEDHATMLERGRRLNETTDGSGLGLAIAAEVAKAYGLNLGLGKASLGGLEVRITQAA